MSFSIFCLFFLFKPFKQHLRLTHARMHSLIGQVAQLLLNEKNIDRKEKREKKIKAREGGRERERAGSREKLNSL